MIVTASKFNKINKGWSDWLLNYLYSLPGHLIHLHSPPNPISANQAKRGSRILKY
jgi:hypothetical protein